MADPEIVEEGKGKKPKGGGKEEGGDDAKKQPAKAAPLPAFVPALIVGIVGIFAAIVCAFLLVRALTPKEPAEDVSTDEKSTAGEHKADEEKTAKKEDKKPAKKKAAGGHGEKKAGSHGEGGGEKGGGSITGNLYSFDKPVIVNLAETNGERYLKVMFSIEMEETELVEELESKKAQILDMLINILSAKTMESIGTTSGRNMLRQELIDKINALLETGRIVNIYFTEFVVQ